MSGGRGSGVGGKILKGRNQFFNEQGKQIKGQYLGAGARSNRPTGRIKRK